MSSPIEQNPKPVLIWDRETSSVNEGEGEKLDLKVWANTASCSPHDMNVEKVYLVVQ